MSILKFNEMKSHKLDIGEDKPVLKYTVKTIYKVEYHDLEAFVKKIYNMRNYEFVANQECSNDSSHEFNINGILGKWELAESEKIRNGRLSCSNRSVLQTLCADGYIEPGTYIINVCW